MNLADKNDLYEYWIFCKVLYAISEIFDLKFIEASGSRGALLQFIKQLMILIGKIKAKSSKMFRTIECKNVSTIIIDAKNSHF